MTTDRTICAWCLGPLRGRPPHDPRPRFCSDACRAQAVCEGLQAGGDSPEAWDGTSLYSTRPLLRTWEVSCLLCGRGVTLQMTEAQALLRSRMGLGRCGHCNGSLLMDREDIGQINSPRLVRVVKDAAA